nr:MAG TPA: Protein of unknown function (DUF1056) [Caudoviricetes sp.]
MKNVLKNLRENLPTVLMTMGAAAVSAGIGWVLPPAGVITGGCFLIAAGWLLIRGGGT